MRPFKFRESRLGWVVMGLGLLAAACQPAAAPPPTAAPAAPAAVPSPALKPAASPSASSAAPSPSALIVPSPVAAVPLGPLVSLTGSYSALIGASLPIWMDSEAGIDKQNGLDINLQYIASSTGIPALLSGQVQIANVGGSETLGAAVGGADVVIIATTLPVYPFVMMAPADVTSVDQLKDKKIGVSNVGSTSDTATRIILRMNGLDPEKDVTIVAVGSLSNRMAALRGHAIDAGVAQPPEQLALEKLGFHVIYNLAAQKVPAVGGAVVVQRSWLNDHHDVAQRYIDSLVQSAVKTRQDKELAIQVLQKYLKTNDQEALQNTYDFFVNNVIPIYPSVSADQFKDTIDTLSANNPAVKDFDVSKILDDSFVQNAMQRNVGGS